MNIKGTATQAFSEGLKQSIGLARRYYLAFAIPVVFGLAWGIISRLFLYGGIMALVSSVMVRSPDTAIVEGYGHLIFVLLLGLIVSLLLWALTFAGAGLILRHRDEQFELNFTEIFSYTGDRIGPLITGTILYVFLPFLPVVIPFIGLFYIIGFFVYIFFIAKNYGGFFFWAYPVITEGKSASEGFAIAKQSVLSKKGPFWTSLVLSFVALWITNLFLGFIPYLGYLFIWALNLIFLIFTGIMYYDYSGDAGQQQISAPPPQG